jgi:hypothetical protein
MMAEFRLTAGIFCSLAGVTRQMTYTTLPGTIFLSDYENESLRPGNLSREDIKARFLISSSPEPCPHPQNRQPQVAQSHPIRRFDTLRLPATERGLDHHFAQPAPPDQSHLPSHAIYNRH